MHRTRLLALVVTLLFALACGSAAETLDGGDGDASNDSGPTFGDSGGFDAGGDACNPPDMLVVLDRSDSMHQAPDGGDAGPSKWALAETAIDDVTAAPVDQTLRFGLALLPDQDLVKGDGGFCGSATVPVALGLGNGATISSTLASTQLLLGTPIGGAMAVAEKKLKAAQQAGRAQYVILVTDGNETCKTAPALPVVQKLAAEGVSTFVVGFGGKADPTLLNDLACAGLTATNFKTSCTLSGGGYVASVPSTTHVFFDAADGPALKTALASIAGGVCCGCVVN